jgi:hypothetical protein
MEGCQATVSSFPRWAAGSSWLGLGFHTQQFCARPSITLSQPTDHPPTSLAAWLPGCPLTRLPATHPPACRPPACRSSLKSTCLPSQTRAGGRCQWRQRTSAAGTATRCSSSSGQTPTPAAGKHRRGAARAGGTGPVRSLGRPKSHGRQAGRQGQSIVARVRGQGAGPGCGARVRGQGPSLD